MTLALILVINANFAAAFETDQYNLPEEPLADIGNEIDDYAYANIADAVATLNAKIDKFEKCLAAGEGCDTKDKNKLKAQLEYLKTEDALALEVFRTMGAGNLMFTKAATYIEKHDFSVSPVRYKTSLIDSIYTTVPSNYFTISPTIKAFGREFGTDKIAHFFQQGYDYYKIYRKELKKTNSKEHATIKAVKWGKRTEATYFGTLVSGVYSNADLAANYAGLQFYLGLTRQTKIGENTKNPVASLKNSRWHLNADNNELLEPFFTDHLNEALNPSVYIVGLRSTIKRSVKKKSCSQWIEHFPESTRGDYETKFAEMSLWNGEDYGFKKTSRPMTISRLCFDDIEKGKAD